MNTPELNNTIRPKVAILGVTGMIGSAIYGVLKDSCDLIVTYRDPDKLGCLYQRYGQPANVQALRVDFMDWYKDYRSGFAGDIASNNQKKFIADIGSVDWVINAMGVTKAIANVDPIATLFLNGSVPHILAAYFNERLIHIATDCVFDGKEGAPYDETSPQHPVDLYGLSKSIGEPSNALVLRTSTIGPELGTKYGLLEWFTSRTEAVPGFTNHLWNGITTYELGKACSKLVTGTVAHPGVGTYHIFSDALTKADMLLAFRNKLGVSTEVLLIAAEVGVDRRLATSKRLCIDLSIPGFSQMVAELPTPQPIS